MQPLVVIAHVQTSVPSYVQVQVEPAQSAAQTLPRRSEHDELHVVGPPDPPADPNPEHECSPEGRGMPGQTVLGTPPDPAAGSVGVTVVELDGPTQFDTACCWESHPPKYSGLPELSQVGCMSSTQRRNAYTADAHDGSMAGNCEQLVMQSLSFSDDEHPDCAIFWQMFAHEAETWAGEQLSPHEASAPSSPASVVRAPQLIVDANRIAAAPKTMHSVFMTIAQS